MSSSPGRDLLHYIVANIDDDTPRLVYADWLDENGMAERAEFVRVQVERTRLPAWDAAQVRLKLREAELLKKHGEAWLAEMPAVPGARWEGFRRGVVAEVSFASFEAMRENAHRCRAVAPVEAVTVRWPRRREAEESAPIAELRELVLTGRPANPEEIGWLADSPQLATLHVLTARGLWGEGLQRLSASPHMGKLRALRLPANDLGNAGVSALVRAKSLTALEELDLTGVGLSDRYNEDAALRSSGLEALARWPGLATVKTLTLHGNQCDRAGLQALVRSPHVAALKSLSLRGGRLDGQAMAEFDGANRKLQLESLDLGENFLGDLGAEYVAIVPCLKELKSLRMDRCEVSRTGAKLFTKKAKFLPGLCILDVSHNHFGAIGLEGLLARVPEALHTLRIQDNDLNDEGVAALAASPASDSLLDLDLSQNGLRDAAAQALIGSEHLRSLLMLRLNDNPIRPPANKTLVASPFGRRLAVLEMENVPPASPMSGDIPF